LSDITFFFFLPPSFQEEKKKIVCVGQTWKKKMGAFYGKNEKHGCIFFYRTSDKKKDGHKLERAQ
jgi:hypothetical protein